MRSIGLGKSVEVKPLDEAVAVDLAAEMLGELFIFGVGATILWLEYRRQHRKDQLKEEIQNNRLLDLENRIQETYLLLETQSAVLREINRALAANDISIPSNKSSGLPNKITDPSSKTILKVDNKSSPTVR